MFGKELTNTSEQREIESVSEIDKETQYEEDKAQEVDLRIVDKELHQEYKKEGMFPLIRKSFEKKEERVVAGFRDEKLPKLGTEQVNSKVEKVEEVKERIEEKQKQQQESIIQEIEIKKEFEQAQNLLQQHPEVPPSPKVFQTALQTITCFCPDSKSPTILFEDLQHSSAFQSANYYENFKLVLSPPITSLTSTCKFRIENIKYCIGFGIGLKEVIERHGYDYKSEGSNELGHGLYIVTSQGYSWSHSEKEEDDVLRAGFNCLYNGLTVAVGLVGQELEFKWKKGEFKLTLPARIREKYTLCFCAYLHEKSDAISISK